MKTSSLAKAARVAVAFALAVAGGLGLGGLGLMSPAAAASAPASSGAPTAQRITFDWRSATVKLPWRSAKLSDGSRCPGGWVTFKPLPPPTESTGVARRGPFTYSVSVRDTADVTRDGRPDQVIHLTCQRGLAGNSLDYLYSYRQVRGHQRPVLRDFVTSSDFDVNADWLILSLDARFGSIAVQQFVRGLDAPVDRVFRWTRRGLIPNRPLPLFPQADVAPR
ncbi:hypothetical protein [Cryptosporangium aurantiacum]|uniref:Uncharacterized protein n=1 Tax=Cryptosporangium aurantiacum TaxID=134849 RepID=A0A1M7RP76_9ACTN|nr:hypothetical protein [Cryptosporangium aurantiacum]SHN48135.1 hypothetical protein SAMN05443668_13432 [Cryptosporangium aurantiacum]